MNGEMTKGEEMDGMGMEYEEEDGQSNNGIDFGMGEERRGSLESRRSRGPSLTEGHEHRLGPDRSSASIQYQQHRGSLHATHPHPYRHPDASNQHYSTSSSHTHHPLPTHSNNNMMSSSTATAATTPGSGGSHTGSASSPQQQEEMMRGSVSGSRSGMGDIYSGRIRDGGSLSGSGGRGYAQPQHVISGGGQSRVNRGMGGGDEPYRLSSSPRPHPQDLQSLLSAPIGMSSQHQQTQHHYGSHPIATPSSAGSIPPFTSNLRLHHLPNSNTSPTNNQSMIGSSSNSTSKALPASASNPSNASTNMISTTTSGTNFPADVLSTAETLNLEALLGDWPVQSAVMSAQGQGLSVFVSRVVMEYGTLMD